MNFFEIVWDWIQSNIIPLLTSTTCATIVAFFIYFIKNRKVMKLNINAATRLSEDFDAGLKGLEEQKEIIMKEQEEISDLKDTVQKNAQMTEGLLALLELIYTSQLTDPKMIQRVKYMITDIKLKYGGTRREIAEKLRQLQTAQEIVIDQTKHIVEDVGDAVGEEVKVVL